MLDRIADYYAEKITTYGCTPKGVDWNSPESQELRFKQLTKIVDSSTHYVLNDLGAGYGALCTYLRNANHKFSYIAYDIAEEMLTHAKKSLDIDGPIKTIKNDLCTEIADYSIASGIFNVQLDYSTSEWEDFIIRTLHNLNEYGQKGFSFNCLTSYSDKEYKQDYLYYAEPSWLFDYCKQHFSRNVALLHDYDLYEFTILVRK